MAVAPTPIDALPPAPDPTQPQESFDTAAYAWSAALPGFVTQVNALAINVKGNADEVESKIAGTAEQVAAATSQAGIATSQAGIAATKAGEASASAALASDWATKTGAAVAGGEFSARHHALAAASSAASAGGYCEAAQGFRNEAAALCSQADAHRAGAVASAAKASEWAEKSTEVEAGKRSAKYWAEQAAGAVSSGVIDDGAINNVKTWSSQKISERDILALTYAARATLRSTPAIAGKQSIVDGLGLFVHHIGSDEPDDDESCFATATGRWLLALPHPDLLAAWALPDDEVAAETASVARRILTAPVTCHITSLGYGGKARFIAAVPGAVPGSAALASPLYELNQALSVSAIVTAADTVTVTVGNFDPTDTYGYGFPTYWQIFVFNKE